VDAPPDWVAEPPHELAAEIPAEPQLIPVAPVAKEVVQLAVHLTLVSPPFPHLLVLTLLQF